MSGPAPPADILVVFLSFEFDDAYGLSRLIDTFSRRTTKINQCQILATLVADLTSRELFCSRDVLFLWTTCSHCQPACMVPVRVWPQMEVLSNAIHLCLRAWALTHISARAG